jgi:hypothetical protein
VICANALGLLARTIIPKRLLAPASEKRYGEAGELLATTGYGKQKKISQRV